MSTSTDAILAYGYDLGDEPDFGFADGEVPTWWDDEQEDFADAAHARLDQEGLATIGVQVVTHCSDSAPKWILAAHVTEAVRGYPRAVSLDDMLADPVRGRWDDKLAWAVETLGLKVQQPPEWLLASYWGA